MFGKPRRGRPRFAVVAAARPNFPKVAPIVRVLESEAEVHLVHTGQHYDDRMSARFFADLGLREPDINLAIGSGSHARQTADAMVAFESYLLANSFDAVIVVGDVNSTIACALTAVKLHIPVAHVEAGLRSRDWRMPEEINRVLTDRISHWLFTTSEDADRNLLAEGAPRDRIFLVGNVMIDSLLATIETARTRHPQVRERLGLSADEPFALMTLHRPSNVDEGRELDRLISTITDACGSLPVIFPVHPRTAERMKDFGVRRHETVRLMEPLGYVDFLGVLDAARMVLTDSGGIQEESSVLGVPCITVRENTERPITVERGTNTLAGTDPERVRDAITSGLQTRRMIPDIPLWDGKSAQRIASVLLEDL